MKIFLESSTQCVKIIKNVSSFNNYFAEFLKYFLCQKWPKLLISNFDFWPKNCTFDWKKKFKL